MSSRGSMKIGNWRIMLNTRREGFARVSNEHRNENVRGKAACRTGSILILDGYKEA